MTLAKPAMTAVSFEPLIFSKERAREEIGKSRTLVETLLKLSEEDKKSVKRIDNVIYGTSIPVISWKFNEWDYYSKRKRLPSYARGLFTSEDGVIMCRGYDKFFNMNEMTSVKEDILRSETTGPYSVTVKSNGCIVFISGLEDGTLMVCSKHSTGKHEGLTKNHAMVAQERLLKQLAENDIEQRTLGELLYRSNMTAVCEFCDDDFEEHVLEYKEEKAGLYLHGLNLNTVDFHTYPIEKVEQFALMFGFKPTKYLKLNTFDETLSFMNECSKTGTFQGEEIEGFVIRCYRNNQDYFFKYKFEEPYHLYREMREVTKQFISDGTLKFGKHKLICMDYIKYVMPYLVTDEKLKVDFMDNKGIIELRKKYFESKKTTGIQMVKDELTMFDLEDEMKKLKFGETKSNRYVLITVATIGCGKTTTAVGLQQLYPELISHVQNDNIQTPGKDKLVEAALDVLASKPIVIIDKNNHKVQERKQIFDSFDKCNDTIPKSKLKFICLNFLDHAPKGDKQLWEITRERVVGRGDNHQSIKVETDGIGNAEKIMRGFISRFQPITPNRLPDSRFDYIIDLDVTQRDSSLTNLKKIVKELKEIITDVELEVPAEEDIIKAFEKAKTYKPTFVKKVKPTKRKPSYFGAFVDANVLLETIKSRNIDFYERLLQLNRVQSDFHVTLVHSAMRREGDLKRQCWELYLNTFKTGVTKFADASVEIPANNKCILPDNYTMDIELQRIIWDSKVMCVEVEILGFHHNGESVGLSYANDHAHVTIGTIDKQFPPMLAGVMLRKYHTGKEADNINVIELNEKKVMKGLPLYVFMN